jgi:hypothetical protein
VSLGVDQTPLLPPEAGLNLNPSSYQSDEWGSQVGSWAFLGSFVQPEHTSSAHQEKGSLSQNNKVVPGRGSPPVRPGMLSQWQAVENTILQIQDKPLEMLQEGSDRDWEGTKALGKQVY